ncbi:O-antigen ligase family protein [Clostridium sp. 'White wine YQ']|uniref:O-antigen ligase family protein n=1 Tax=Clostridium sp. 'White wine YQ' TaxID=3027474 RepID=UPI002366B271|nr:O-antigen ligase family protein [Clostridium sp. 'White wine YQ']MDD7795775.1 O-antigen ligase family protein [Clostridium sp. 'White wine YQ']
MYKKEATLILTFIAGIMPLIMYPYGDDSYYLPKAIFLYVMCPLLIMILFLDRKKLVIDKKDVTLMIFILFVLISTYFSMNIIISVLGNEVRYEGLIMIIFYGIIYYTAKRYLIIDKKAIRFITVVTIIIAIYSIFQYYGIDPIPKDTYHALIKNNSIGTLGNRNFLSTYITLFLPIILGLYILKGRIKFLVAATILFSSLLCTLTRSGWLAFLIYSLIGLIYVIRKNDKVYLKRIGIILIIFTVIAVVVNNSTSGSIKGRGEQLAKDTEAMSEDSGSGRIYIWNLAIKTTEAHPFLGSGPDTFRYVIEKEFTNEGIVWIQEHGSVIDKAHNEFLQISSTMGIPALLAYLLFLIFVIKDNLKSIFKNEVSFLFSITIIGYLVQSFFNISVINVAPLFWLLLGASNNIDIKRDLKNDLLI